MMKYEFIERTNYTPSDEEYHYIEESYYDYDGCSKDEFCKQWLKDKRSGKWSMELRFRMQLDAQEAKYKARIAGKEEMLEFYREQYREKQQLLETIKQQDAKLETLKRIIDSLASVFDS